HEHELARHRYGAQPFERLVHAKGLAPAVFGGLHPVGKAAHAIFQERSIDKPSPDIQRLDNLAVEPAKTPRLVRMYDQLVLVSPKPLVQVDDAAHEFCGKDPDASVVE